MLSAGRAWRSRFQYPSRSLQSTVRWYRLSQGRYWAIQVSLTGAIDSPSPVTSVVIPCRIFDSTRLSTRRFSSDWPSMSMKPGVTYFPVASTRRFAEAFSSFPIAAIATRRRSANG